MSEFKPQKPQGFDLCLIPGYNDQTSFAEVIRYFQDQLPGKTLAIHHGSQHGDVHFSSQVHWSGVLENGNVAIVAEDAFKKPVVHEFHGQKTRIIGSLRTREDVWFTEDSETWYGLYDSSTEEQINLMPEE